MPPPLTEALLAIHAIACSSEGPTFTRAAQRGLDRLEHDAETVTDVLSGLTEQECVNSEPALWMPNGQIYIFRVSLENELDLYVKVALNLVTMQEAEVMAYKLWGSPA